jgi:hypothetical protein
MGHFVVVKDTNLKWTHMIQKEDARKRANVFGETNAIVAKLGVENEG